MFDLSKSIYANKKQYNNVNEIRKALLKSGMLKLKTNKNIIQDKSRMVIRCYIILKTSHKILMNIA